MLADLTRDFRTYYSCSVHDIDRLDGEGRRLMPTREFLDLVSRLPPGSHFFARRTAEAWNTLTPGSDDGYQDDDPRAWRDWDASLRMIANLVNEVRALRVTFYNTFQKKSIDFTPVRAPGSGLPGHSSSDDDAGFVISSITGGIEV